MRPRLVPGQITPRMIDVLQAAWDGLTDDQTAKRLKIARQTVHHHKENVRVHYDLPHMAPFILAVRKAVKEGLLQP